jgi:hypothetical protein
MNTINLIARRAIWTGAFVLVGSQMLAACAPLLVGGAVIGGALVATDRRTSGARTCQHHQLQPPSLAHG